MGRIHAGAAVRDSRSRLCVSVDAVSARAESFAAEFGGRAAQTFDEALADDDVGAVIIALPHSLHREYCVRASNAGKHVLIEKPLSLTLEDADEMIEAAREARTILLVAHVLRFVPGHVRIKQLIDRGDLGRPFMARYRNEHFPRLGTERLGWLSKRGEGGVPLAGSIHHADLIRWWMGEVESVRGFERSWRAEFQENDQSDVSMILYRVASGALGETTYSYATLASELNMRPNALVNFEHGTVSVFPGEMRIYDERKGGVVIAHADRSGVGPHAVAPAAKEVPHLTRCILDGEKLVIEPNEARRAVELIIASTKSAESGVEIKV
jgi:predicted dehydrogenase